MVLHGGSDSFSLNENENQKQEEEKNKAFHEVIIGCLGFVILLPIMIVVGCVIDVFLFRQLVEWFVLPLDETIGTYLLNIHWATLLGLLLLKSFIIRNPTKKDKPTKDETAIYIMIKGFVCDIILRPLVYITLGYIFTLFM